MTTKRAKPGGERFAAFELWQNGQRLAATFGPRFTAAAQISFYATVYLQDGRAVEIRELKGKKKSPRAV